MKPLPIILSPVCALLLGACGGGTPPGEAPVELSQRRYEIDGSEMQGTQLQGTQLQGAVLQGSSLLGVRFQGATLGGEPLQALRVEEGGLVAELPSTLTGWTPSLESCSSPTSGEARGCGFSWLGGGWCTPGTLVQVDAGATGLGSCTGDPVLRVCAGTSPCEHADGTYLASSNDGLPLSSAFAMTASALNACPAVEFICPASGTYTALGGAATSGDAWSMRVGVSTDEFGAKTLEGKALEGAELVGSTTQGDVPLRLTIVENAMNVLLDSNGQPWDPSGVTFLYHVEHYLPGEGHWATLCPEGQGLAVPVSGIFDNTGARSDSSDLFTFGCDSGVVAKCYRWGYKPWRASMDPDDPDLWKRAHHTCTRMARADYCGDGTSYTKDGTRIEMWDRLVNRSVEDVSTTNGMVFEAGWTPEGASCLSHDRWTELKTDLCPGKLVAPDYIARNGARECNSTELQSGEYLCASVCDVEDDALLFDPTVLIFNQSFIQ